MAKDIFKMRNICFPVSIILIISSIFSVSFINASAILDTGKNLYKNNFQFAEKFEQNIQNLLPENYSPSYSSYYRLNLTVTPITYALNLRPVLDDGYPSPLDKFTAPSSVNISVQSISRSNTITLHQRDLNIALEKVTVTNVLTGKQLPISSQTFEVERDLYEIKLDEPFQIGDLLAIYIPYIVRLSQTENVGIYLGHYVDPSSNKTKYLSATKLEPHHARKVFPVFDEPSIKAKFKISVGRLDGKYHSLSNMNILKTVPDTEYDGWVWDHYEESVLMSSYLVCVIVSDFANTTVVDSKNRPISTWAPKHDMDLQGGEYGAFTGEKILNYFENKFKMDYALPKLDAVALPQFASGAMENFGLVTYRYGYLIWIPGENTEAERRKVSQVLSHEISHQWYGNIVTCAWWSDIWLNEGFARFLQFWAMKEILPEFLVDEAFVTDATQLAMVFDQGPKTHPVKNSAESPTKVLAVFDRVSYEKAASLLRMIEGFLTKPVFETGFIDLYLPRMKWTAAYQDDVFRAYQDAVDMHDLSENLLPVGVTIKDIMDTWTLQSGYPLVRISVSSENTVSISQEPFTLTRQKKENSKLIVDDDVVDDDKTWWIPIRLLSNDDTDNFNSIKKLPDTWMPNNVKSLTYSRNGLKTSNLLMGNPDATGFYRVLYDNSLTDLIKQQLLSNDYQIITSSSRSQLFDDYFNFAWANYTDVETVFQLTEYLGKEISSNVWTTVLTHLKPIVNKFSQNQQSTNILKNYFVPRLESTLNLIGLKQSEGDRGVNVTLRAQLLEVACQLEMPSCLDYATELVTLWQDKPEINPFPVDIQSSLYSAASFAAASSESDTTWMFLYGRFNETAKETQKTLLINALASAHRESRLQELLFVALSSQQDYISQILTRIAMNPLGREIAYKEAKNYLANGSIKPELFASVISTLSQYWNTQGHIEELQQFIDENYNRLEPILENLNTSVKNIQGNIIWWNTFGVKIQGWLENQ